MVPYSDKPAILDMMVYHSKSGDATTSNLKNIGVTSEKQGVRAGGRRAPSTHKVGKRSWVRIEPLASGVRAELHLHDDEDVDKVTAKANELIRKMRGE
jgi:hypothetical protein